MMIIPVSSIAVMKSLVRAEKIFRIVARAFSSFGLFGFHKKYGTLNRSCNVQFLGAVKGIYIGITTKEKILHKYVFVALFHVSGKQALNLADSQFPDGGSGL